GPPGPGDGPYPRGEPYVDGGGGPCGCGPHVVSARMPELPGRGIGPGDTDGVCRPVAGGHPGRHPGGAPGPTGRPYGPLDCDCGGWPCGWFATDGGATEGTPEPEDGWGSGRGSRDSGALVSSGMGLITSQPQA